MHACVRGNIYHFHGEFPGKKNIDFTANVLSYDAVFILQLKKHFHSHLKQQASSADPITLSMQSNTHREAYTRI